MELMDGGELFDYVVEKGTLSEEEASQIVRIVLSAVQYVILFCFCFSIHFYLLYLF